MKRVIEELNKGEYRYAYINEKTGVAQFSGIFYGTKKAVDKHIGKTIKARKNSFNTCNIDKYENKGKWHNVQINEA